MNELEAIKLIESEHLKEDIQALSHKDRISIYLILKEWEKPKLQRVGHEPFTEEEHKIILDYANND